MPYAIRKVPNKPCYMVYNKKNKHVSAKCTTRKRAQKQIRLLNAIEHNKDFVPRSRKTRKSRR